MYVEGKTDKTVFGYILGTKRKFGVRIWADQEIEIDICEVSSEGGARSRLLAVCGELGSRGFRNAIGIIDKDTSLYPHDISVEEACIIPTTFTSLEFHCTDIARIKDIINLKVQTEINSSDWSSIESICRKLFAIRHIADRGILHKGFPKLERSITGGRGNISFSLDDFLKRLDNKAASFGTWMGLKEKIENYELGSTIDARHLINFHDLESVCGVVLSNFYGIQHGLEDGWLGGLVRAQVDEATCAEEFFEAVLKRLGVL